MFYLVIGCPVDDSISYSLLSLKKNGDCLLVEFKKRLARDSGLKVFFSDQAF